MPTPQPPAQQVDVLKELAEKATPGPWRVTDDEDGLGVHTPQTHYEHVENGWHSGEWDVDEGVQIADFSFDAEADPRSVLDRVAALLTQEQTAPTGEEGATNG